MGISRQQALDCFASDDLIGIGMEADAVRRALHPEGVVSYAIDLPVALGATKESLTAQIEAALEQGGTGIVVRDDAGLSLASIEEALGAVKTSFPQLHIRGFAAAEVLAVAERAQLAVADVVARLRAAGLDALLGEGAGVLVLEGWLAVHRAAHRAGLASTATLTFGADETMADRVAFLEAVHMLQQETGGFVAFTLVSHHAPGGRELDDATAVEYLKTLAICRMVLDNIPHAQTNWEQQGLKVLQMGLRFGGNDIGSLLGADAAAPEEEVRRLIRDAGFKPVQRDTLYRTHFLN